MCGSARGLTRIGLQLAILPEKTADRQAGFPAETSGPKNSDKLCVTKICSVWYPFVCSATTQSGAQRLQSPRKYSLNPFDRCEPGRRTVFVESGVKPVGFDGGDIPSIAEVERRSQLFLADWVRANIGAHVTEA